MEKLIITTPEEIHKMDTSATWINEDLNRIGGRILDENKLELGGIVHYRGVDTGADYLEIYCNTGSTFYGETAFVEWNSEERPIEYFIDFINTGVWGE